MTAQTSVRWLSRMDSHGGTTLKVVTGSFDDPDAYVVAAIAPADDGGTLLRMRDDDGEQWITHTATPYLEVRDAAKNICGGHATMLLRDLEDVEGIPLS